LEILSELGVIGLSIILLIFARLIYLFFKIKNNAIVINSNFILPFVLLFFVEIFPLKTSGSFFTTGNATYIFLLIAVIVGLLNKLSYDKNLK
jgi:O-antigen ligase